MITAELIKRQYQQYMAQKAASLGEDIPPDDIMAALTQAEQKGDSGDGTKEDSQ